MKRLSFFVVIAFCCISCGKEILSVPPRSLTSQPPIIVKSEGRATINKNFYDRFSWEYIPFMAYKKSGVISKISTTSEGLDVYDIEDISAMNLSIKLSGTQGKNSFEINTNTSFGDIFTLVPVLIDFKDTKNKRPIFRWESLNINEIHELFMSRGDNSRYIAKYGIPKHVLQNHSIEIQGSKISIYQPELSIINPITFTLIDLVDRENNDFNSEPGCTLIFEKITLYADHTYSFEYRAAFFPNNKSETLSESLINLVSTTEIYEDRTFKLLPQHDSDSAIDLSNKQN